MAGKLDPNFVNWLAQSWLIRYGGTFHQKRADVLRHFKKDSANLAIAWEQYRGEQVQRYENAAVRMGNGLEIQPTEQEQLLQNARAIANPLPQEFNPVTEAVDLPVLVGEIKAETTETAIPPSSQAIPINPLGEWEGLLENQENEQSLSHPFPVRPRTGGSQNLTNGHEHNSSICPTDNDGCVLSPSSYQQWQPQSEPDDSVVAYAFKEKLAAFNNLLSISSTKSNKHKQSSKTELEELNAWLVDPILRQEVMARVMRSEFYKVEFDEAGEPLGVVEIKF